jgi:uncharacterized protein
MHSAETNYDFRYLGGIHFFNERDFFEAHEVWESIWMHSSAPERKFYQGLIQVAVALYHFNNGNLRGAIKLYHSSRKYLEAFQPAFLGLDLAGFQAQMDRCFAEMLAHPNGDHAVELQDEEIPTIVLDPAPEQWPDPAEFENLGK